MTVMGAESAQVDARARKSLSLCLQRLASVGQRPVAEALGVHESTVSRLKDGELERFCRIVALLGLKVVSGDRVCVKEDEYLMMTRIVSRALANERTARELLFEEPE